MTAETALQMVNEAINRLSEQVSESFLEHQRIISNNKADISGLRETVTSMRSFCDKHIEGVTQLAIRLDRLIEKHDEVIDKLQEEVVSIKTQTIAIQNAKDYSIRRMSFFVAVFCAAVGVLSNIDNILKLFK